MRKGNTGADKALPGRLLPALGKGAGGGGAGSPSQPVFPGSLAVLKGRGGRAVSVESLRAKSLTASESSGEGTGPRS